jgi:hypothetical protein
MKYAHDIYNLPIDRSACWEIEFVTKWINPLSIVFENK